MEEIKLTVETERGPVKVRVPKCVYAPAEDTLMAVRLLNRLYNEGFRFKRIVDVCTGSGILAVVSERLFKPSILVAIDISPYAVYAALSNLEGKGLALRCDGLSCIRGLFDIVIVNPPYLPGENLEDECEGYYVLSWADNLDVMRRTCESASLIAENVLFVHSSLSHFNPEKCFEKRGFKPTYVIEKRFFMEQIFAVLYSRSKRV